MSLNSHFRSFLVFVFDILAVLLAWFGAYLIRFNFEWPAGYEDGLYLGILPLTIAQLLACHWAGLYRGMWIFASLPDLRRVLKAVAFSALILLLFATLMQGRAVIPRSVILLYPILLLVIMSGGRLAWRMWKERQLYEHSKTQGKPVVVIGAGTAGVMLVRELGRSADWNVVALVDDDQHKWGLELLGRRVEAGTDKLPEIMQRWNAKHAILAMPSASAEALQRITKIATSAGANLFTVPGLGELMSGRVAINVMRPVKIEDLLGRHSVEIDNSHVRTMLTGKRLLVTGAGGSIGSELCRQLSRFNPSHIVLVEASEFALYMIEQWFREHRPEIEVFPMAADVKNVSRIRHICEQYRPEVVFHAAAYKHVPLMEVNNAWQAVQNNVAGTRVVAQEAIRIGAERFVLISTDKAVNPTNVMGATKRMAEMVCETLHCQQKGTRIQIVRFGNVLGSTGSVIPRFKAQIENGGPVTVTHPDITRYFMSIPEAAQLVLQAAAMGDGGEIFVLDMGEPVKIVDLAKNMIRLAGYTEDEVRIEFTGLRPGEKLFEELLADSEETRQTPHPKLRIARSRPVPAEFESAIEHWLDQNRQVPDEEVRAQLKQWIPEYDPKPSHS